MPRQRLTAVPAKVTTQARGGALVGVSMQPATPGLECVYPAPKVRQNARARQKKTSRCANESGAVRANDAKSPRATARGLAIMMSRWRSMSKQELLRINQRPVHIFPCQTLVRRP